MRGDIVLVDLSGADGVEKQNPEGKGARPCIIAQNDEGEANSPMSIVAPLTQGQRKKYLPVQAPVTGAELGKGGHDSIAECGHIRSIDRKRIKRIVGQVDPQAMARIDLVLKATLGL